MRRLPLLGAACGLAAGLAALPAVARAQWPPDSFTNLKVLPKDIPQRQLIDLMASFTRALGVRCTHCHVGEEGQPLATYKFALDDKLAKRKARVMLRMVQAINGDHLAGLEERADPPVRVECATCHRGATQPWMLQDVLLHAYQGGSLDSTLATYRTLRERFYGRFTYDFSEVPLADVAQRVWDQGRAEDAVRLHALNVEMNPTSAFAKRQHATAALTLAFREQGPEAGTTLYRELKGTYGAAAFPEGLLNQLGYRFLEMDRADLAITAFKLNVEAFPTSFNAYDSLGEAYMRHGDRELAIQSYEKSLQLNPQNANGRRKLEELRAGAGGG